jgi:hypothetical protein
MAAIDEDQRAVVLRLLRLALHDPGAAARLPATELDLLMQLLRYVQLDSRFAADLKRDGAFERMPLVAWQQLESILFYADTRARLALWELNHIDLATRDRRSP